MRGRGRMCDVSIRAGVRVLGGVGYHGRGHGVGVGSILKMIRFWLRTHVRHSGVLSIAGFYHRGTHIWATPLLDGYFDDSQAFFISSSAA